MHVEGGSVRYTAPTGEDWTFAPSFERIGRLGTPQEVVDLFAGLFGAHAAEDARYVLACLCEQADPLQLLGWVDEQRADHAGVMPADLQILIARHLMQLSFLDAGEALSLPEYQSILDMKFMDHNLTSPSWTAYLARLKEMTNG